MVIRISGKFFNPFIEPLNLCCLFLIGCHVLVQGFAVQLRKIKLFQPVQVSDAPFMTVIDISMTETEGVDLLLDLFQRQFVIIPHPEVFLNRGILICGNMNRVITTIGKALCDHHRITFVGFDPFPLLSQHRCRCQDCAFDTGFGQLVIKGVAEAAGLVATFNGIGIGRAKPFLQVVDKLNHIFIIRSYLNVCKDSVFSVKYRLHCA